MLKGNSVYFTLIHSKDKFLTIDIVIVPGLQSPLISITKDEEDCVDIVLALDSCSWFQFAADSPSTSLPSLSSEKTNLDRLELIQHNSLDS